MSTQTLELTCRLTRGTFRLQLEATLCEAATGLFGRSGSGKTSLLLALAGLLPADELRVSLDGQALFAPGAPAHRRRIGMVFQDHRLFPHRSIAANLRYARPPAAGPTWDEVVRLLDLAPILTRRPDQCSGGERQRAALGRSLLAAPRLLLLDEPLASLDRGLKLQILPYLARIQERFELPMLMVSHDLSDLLAVTSELLLLERGKLAGQGTVAALAADSTQLDLLHDCGLVFALGGMVARRDPDGLAWIRLDGPASAALACGDSDHAPGTRVEILLRPEDIILARPPLDAQLSLTNHLPATVTQLTQTRARTLVTLDAGLSNPLLAEVTERAVRTLALAPGTQVIALCKAQATRTRSYG